MEQHTHGPDGLVIVEAPDAAAVEAVADDMAQLSAAGQLEQPAIAETITDANVEIARIEAGRDVELAKLSVKAEQADTSELDQLRGEVAALRAIIDAMTPPEPEPEPDPAPVIVEAPPEEPTEPAPPVVEDRPVAPKKPSGLSWF
jgi:hypothetical protein